MINNTLLTITQPYYAMLIRFFICGSVVST